MILEAALAMSLMLKTLPKSPISANPFADDCTISWENNGQFIVKDFPYDPTDPLLLKPSIPAQPIFANEPVAVYPNNSSLPMETLGANETIPTSDSNSSMISPIPNDVIIGCKECSPPTQSMNYKNIYTMYIILVPENMAYYSWPTNEYQNALNHLKTTFQYVRATYLRDAGVDLKIANVLFNQQLLSTNNNPESIAHVRSMISQMNITHRIDGIMRLVYFNAGGASASPCNPNGPTVGESYYPFWLDFNIPNNQLNSENMILYTLFHELGHQLLWLEHSSCYWESSSPVDPCDSECYSGPDGLIPPNELSYMSYCPTDFLPQWVNLRAGNLFGSIQSVARWNVLHLPCLGSPTTKDKYFIPDIAIQDTDGDEIPDIIDNCPYVSNPDQKDANMNGIGDACDKGCQVTKPIYSFWQLLFFPLIFLWRKLNESQ